MKKGIVESVELRVYRKQGEGNGAEVMKIEDFAAKISAEVAEQMNDRNKNTDNRKYSCNF